MGLDVLLDFDETLDNESPIISVYPNPFENRTIFELQNEGNRKVTFSLFDLNSRIVGQETFSTNSYEFERQQLPSGLYIFRMEASGELMGSGKIVLK